MAANHIGTIVREPHRTVGFHAMAERTDSQLLQDFAASQREEAFAALLHRHGPMVWSVCRHILPHEQDAEDAFQATFLVLARRAGSIRRTEALAGWLHRVASRIARKARTMAMKRNQREMSLEHEPPAPPVSDLAWRELQGILDEELQRLPEKYRSPFILCCLEGRSRAEAAAELGWKEGTLSSRIAHARALLEECLSRRGVKLSVALTAGVLWNQPASAALMQATQKSALLVAAGQTVSAVVSPTVAALMEGVAGMAVATAKISAGLITLCLWAYWSTLERMAHKWLNDPQYSHGYLVPAFAVYLLWHRRSSLGAISWRSDWRGLPLLAAGVILRLAGSYLHFDWLDAFSLLPCLAGISVLLGGWSALRWCWPAIAFLAFMIPLPYRVETALGQPLQRIATIGSTYTLQTFGFTALAEGNTIQLASGKMGVADACSGLSMLLVFFALSTALVIVVRRPLLDTCLLVASSLPIAIIVNIIRIAGTGAVQELFGRRAALGITHDLAGWLMMPMALALFGVQLWVFGRLLQVPRRTRPLAIQ